MPVHKSFWGVYETVETCELIDKLPNCFVACMKNMRTVQMHVNAFPVLGVAIASYVPPSVNNQAAIASISGKTSKDCSKHATSDNQKIILWT
jgi:hypothetical protein